MSARRVLHCGGKRPPWVEPSIEADVRFSVLQAPNRPVLCRAMTGSGRCTSIVLAVGILPGAESPDSPRHGRRRPAIHDCPSCITEVVDGRPSPAMTGVGNVRQYFRPPV